MSEKETIQYDIMSEAIFVSNKEKFTLPTQDSGLVSRDLLERTKYVCAMDGFKWATNHLVKVKSDYPRVDDVDVELSLDCVVLPTKVYTKLMKYLDNE
jgi:hypothetical protein